MIGLLPEMVFFRLSSTGDVKFVDIDGNGKIDDNDKVNLGNGMPKFTYGLNLNFYWRNFDLGIVATGSAGFKIVQSYRNQTTSRPTIRPRFLTVGQGKEPAIRCLV